VSKHGKAISFQSVNNNVGVHLSEIDLVNEGRHSLG